MQIIAIFVLAIMLAACDNVTKDVGADVAACNLEEMKSNYPDKALITPDVLKARESRDEVSQKVLLEMLNANKRQFVSLCMRAKGWQLKAENYCPQKDFDQANCYEPATAARDGIIAK